MPEDSSEFRKSYSSSLKTQNNWTANKKSQIQDYCNILESVAWLWRIFGVFPIAVKTSIGIKKYEITKFLAVYSSLIFGMCMGNFLFVTANFEFYYSGTPFRVTAGTIFVRSIGNILSIVSSTVYRLLNHEGLSESINNVTEQNLILKTINCKSNYELSVIIIRIYVWASLSAVIFLMIFDANSVHHNYRSLSPEYVIWTISLSAQVISLTVFTSFVGLLGLNFYSLNKKIRIVVTRANAPSPKVLVTSNDCSEQLRFISELHYNMCAVGKRINRVFDWEVIINVTVAFVILSTTLYHIFYEVEREGPTDVPRIFTYIHWELFHSIPIIIIVIICNLTSHQSVRAGELIHEIRVENTDSELYQTVKSFSLQLHHQKLEFTAGGFFPINSTLLQTMVGKITTYLVILIQFKPKLT